MRSFLAWLARLGPIRKIAISTPVVRDLAWRFVAGENLESGIEVVQALNRSGVAGALNCVGTHVFREEDAVKAADAAVGAVRRIRSARLDCYLSLKLTQIGLDVDEVFCRKQLQRVLAAAAEEGVFVRLDMEESIYLEATLRIFEEARNRFGSAAVGIAMQSYLKGTDSTLERLLRTGARVRLVKGGYWESENVVCRSKHEIDQRFENDLQQLMSTGIDPAVATHDLNFIRCTIELAEKFQRKPGEFEFQMLYGVGREIQQDLVKKGFRVRCYVPYGGDWFTYFLGCLRRLPEGLWREFKERALRHRPAAIAL